MQYGVAAQNISCFALLTKEYNTYFKFTFWIALNTAVLELINIQQYISRKFDQYLLQGKIK